MNKYIHNKHIALIRCRVKPTGQQFDFYPERKDKFTGQTEHTGYTEVSEADLESLQKHSKVFTQSVERGHLAIESDIPISAQAPSQVIVHLRGQVSLLEAENLALKEELAKYKEGTGVVDKPAKTKVKETEKPAEDKKDFE